jgi:hypothetical protein
MKTASRAVIQRCAALLEMLIRLRRTALSKKPCALADGPMLVFNALLALR